VCDLKNLIGAPLRANRCREMPRVGAFFVCGAWFRFGEVTMCKTHLDKTLDSTPSFSTERYLSALLGFGMRLARIPYSSVRHPYSAMSSPVNRRGTGWRWESKSVRLASTATVKSIDPDAFMRSWTKLPVITF
jgi:hypothetical protein